MFSHDMPRIIHSVYIITFKSLSSINYKGNCLVLMRHRKVPKFSDARQLCTNQPKIRTKRPNFRVFHQNDANGKANSEDPDQTAPLGAV